MRNNLQIQAHAKINLGLDVTGRREDGYHLVRMIMQALELHDTLFFEEIPLPEDEGDRKCIQSSCPHIELEIVREGGKSERNVQSAENVQSEGTEDHPSLPADRSNLVVRAAELLLSRHAPKKGVRIRLVKRIPLAAGLAGGSTDAAAALRGINELFQLNLTDMELRRLGVQLGADIPYCIMGGTALSEGIGEVLTPLPDLPHCYIVLGKPSGGMSTMEAYRALDEEEEIRHPDIEGQIRALQEGSLEGVSQRLGNVLEPVTERRHPEIRKIRDVLLKAGAIGARMSGSGPTVFGLFTEERKAIEACSVLKQEPSREVILTVPAQNGRNA